MSEKSEDVHDGDTESGEGWNAKQSMPRSQQRRLSSNSKVLDGATLDGNPANGHSINEDQEREITRLARAYSSMSARSQSTAPFSFDPAKGSTLDPTSDKFDPERWAKSFMNALSKDPERYSKRTAGVSYKNLSVHGFGSATDYQKNFANVFLYGFNSVRNLLGREQQKIQILKDFDGLVRSGEMLVVLGRPGRYVCHIQTQALASNPQK